MGSIVRLNYPVSSRSSVLKTLERGSRQRRQEGKRGRGKKEGEEDSTYRGDNDELSLLLNGILRLLIELLALFSTQVGQWGISD